MTVRNMGKKHWFNSYKHFCDSVIFPYLAFISFFIMGGPAAVWVVIRSLGYVKGITEDSTGSVSITAKQIATTVAASIVLYCWMNFGTLYALHYYILYQFEHYQSTRPEGLPELYLPCSTPGHYMLYVLGGLFLAELPILLYFIHKNTKKISDHKSGRVKNYKIYFCNSLRSGGCLWLGMVYYLQLQAGFFVYFLIFLIANPLSAIRKCAQVISIALLQISVTSVILHPCVHRRRVQCRAYCFLLYASLVALNLNVPSYLLDPISKNNWNTSFDITEIISTIFTTVLLSVLGFFAKAVLFYPNPRTKSKNTDRDHSERDVIEGFALGDELIMV